MPVRTVLLEVPVVRGGLSWQHMNVEAGRHPSGPEQLQHEGHNAERPSPKAATCHWRVLQSEPLSSGERHECIDAQTVRRASPC